MDEDDLPPVLAFGEWDAPVTDGAQWLDEAPTDLTCMGCQEHFRPGDNGAIMPNGFAQHRECALRTSMGGIGHLVDHARYCHGELGTDAGLSHRLSSILVWRTFVDGERFTEEDLTGFRKLEEQAR